MIILAVDLGKVRTGLAVCDPGEMLASPLTVIHESDPEQLVQKIAEAAAERKARQIVVGLPRNMDGSEGESAQSARTLAKRIGEVTGLPVELMDERGTTVTAHIYMNDVNRRGAKRKSVVDAVAATVILENFLQGRRLRGEKP